MTALKEYARLETSGLWRSGAEAQRRDVGVSFGDATLVISDAQGRPLTHWSLAAVTRLNPRNTPALFSPDGIEEETLEVSDAEMIAAIEHVQATIARARPRPGRLRWAILLSTVTAIVALGVFWLPEAIIRQTVAVVPEVKRAEIGRALVAEAAQVTGQPCADPFGMAGLRRLKAAFIPGRTGTLSVMRSGTALTVGFPGQYILLNRSLVEDFDDPAVVQGYLLAELARAEAEDPLETLLRSTGPISAFRLLTRGSLPPETLEAYATSRLTGDPVPVDSTALLARFREAMVPARPYAFAVDVTGETTLDLIEADPFDGVAPKQHLSDGDWISLQQICDAG